MPRHDFDDHSDTTADRSHITDDGSNISLPSRSDEVNYSPSEVEGKSEFGKVERQLETRERVAGDQPANATEHRPRRNHRTTRTRRVW